jgi:RNA polymerase sigma-70 factor (ECF subfamily)
MSCDGSARDDQVAVDPLDQGDVDEVLHGDREAYARIVRRYQPAIKAYMWRFTRDPTQWEELVHDVFVEAYFSLPRYAGRAPLLHWLKRIATRLGYRYWQRRQRLRTEVSLTDALAKIPTGKDDAQASREAAELVHLLLDQLSPRDRLVVTLTRLEGRSIAEVASLTGWSASLVKVQLHRAMGRLARLCQDLGIEP